MHALIQCYHGEVSDVTGIEERKYNLGFMDGTVLYGPMHNLKFLSPGTPDLRKVATFLAKFEEIWQLLALFPSSYGEFHSEVSGNPVCCSCRWFPMSSHLRVPMLSASSSSEIFHHGLGQVPCAASLLITFSSRAKPRE